MITIYIKEKFNNFFITIVNKDKKTVFNFTLKKLKQKTNISSNLLLFKFGRVVQQFLLAKSFLFISVVYHGFAFKIIQTKKGLYCPFFIFMAFSKSKIIAFNGVKLKKQKRLLVLYG